MTTNIQSLFDDGRSTLFSPAVEIGAYEALWGTLRTTPRVAKMFSDHQHQLPSTVAHAAGISDNEIDLYRGRVAKLMPLSSFHALFHQDFEYPQRLRDAANPAEVLYARGDLSLLASKVVSIVGTREASADGVKRATRLARELVQRDITVASGLALGIDTAAHLAAIEAGGRTIAVVGTALHDSYPLENAMLQERIATEHLLVSHVPFFFSSERTWVANRAFFPERNVTMSALSNATIIVEAGETSGTLYQAKAALRQGRKLFILNSCFERGLAWPEEMQRKGAIRVREVDDVVVAFETPHE
jgi:DNA processing protein